MPAASGEEDAPASSILTEVPPADDGAPLGPDEVEESAFLAEQRAQGFAPTGPAAAQAAPEPETGGSLPPLDELVNRIPESTRQLMDELFRARFITVRRVPKSALKE